MSHTISEITRLTAAERVGSGADIAVEWLLTDSRSLAFAETSLFFALRTRTGDGHRYIGQLYRQGVRHFVVESVPDDADIDLCECNFLVVSSPLLALQQVAGAHRAAFDIPVVGITGSNGKTTVKEWLAQLFAATHTVVRSPRSYNTQIGVPLSVWQLAETSDLGIFEAAITHPGEMAFLERVVRPTYGVMTCLGEAHQQHFESYEQKCREKLSLFASSKALVYPADDATICACLDEMGYRGERVGWTTQDNPDALLRVHVEGDSHSTVLHYDYAHGQRCGSVCVPFVTKAGHHNAISVLAMALLLGLDEANLTQGMASLTPLAMRLEVKEGIKGITLINDSYNADIDSLGIALDFLHRRSHGKRTVLVLSDMFQTGMSPQAWSRKVAEMIRLRGINVLIGVGEWVRRLAPLIDIPFYCFDTTSRLLDSHVLDDLAPGDVVLLKGARSFAFERLEEYLTLKVHETTLEVNLLALADNLRHYRSLLAPGVKVTCMVKASAYGAGSLEVAETLQDLGVDYLAVAVADEGAALREAGITAGIIVMNPEMSAFKTLFRYNLEPEIYNFRLLHALIAAAESEGVTGFPVHIKFDTGMCRLGFDPRHDIPALAACLSGQSNVVPRSVFTHFAGADDAAFDAFSDQQFALFDRASAELQSHFSHHILRHICNTAGITRWPHRHLDMVRLGLGLYGVDPLTNKSLSTVSTLRTTILQIRDVAAGTSVGYGRHTVVERPSRIAALPIGYADGLDRHLGNRHGYCLIGGQRAEYVGNICMDVCMVDVTDIPCHEGDSVEIFGPNLPLTELSTPLGTIPYEILTSISERVKRIYVRS